MSTGQGFAGILMNLVRYVTLFSFFSGEKTPEEIANSKFYESIIFFSFSAIVCVACLVTCFFLYKNEYFYLKLQNSGEFDDVDSQALSSASTEDMNLLQSSVSYLSFLYNIKKLYEQFVKNKCK